MKIKKGTIFFCTNHIETERPDDTVPLFRYIYIKGAFYPAKEECNNKKITDFKFIYMYNRGAKEGENLFTEYKEPITNRQIPKYQKVK